MSLIEHHVGFTLRLFSYLRLTTALAATLQTIFVSFVIVAVNLITGILTARYLGPGRTWRAGSYVCLAAAVRVLLQFGHGPDPNLQSKTRI